MKGFQREKTSKEMPTTQPGVLVTTANPIHADKKKMHTLKKADGKNLRGAAEENNHFSGKLHPPARRGGNQYLG